MNFSTKSKPSLPTSLVQYAARGLIVRSESIKVNRQKLHEISTAPLSLSDWKAVYPDAQVTQTYLTDEPAPEVGWLQRLKKTMSGAAPQSVNWSMFSAADYVVHQAALVFAPMVLDLSDDVLAAMALMPRWFAKEGVLLFATLANGSLPELVNAQPEWLSLLGHWYNIMDAGARLQALNFGLPVLDVETITLSYRDFTTLWHDLLTFLPLLQSMSEAEKQVWQDKAHDLFKQGVRQLSLEILYGQVWQPTVKTAKTEHTVSLESLTNQLTKRHYPS